MASLKVKTLTKDKKNGFKNRLVQFGIEMSGLGFRICFLVVRIQLSALRLWPLAYQALIFMILLLIRDSETGVMPKKLAM